MITRAFVEVTIHHEIPLERSVVAANLDHALTNVWVGVQHSRTQGSELIMMVLENAEGVTPVVEDY